jgi:hypothetical protein
MAWLHSAVDSFHIHLTLSTQLENEHNNDSLFHYFEMMQRSFPDMTSLDSGDSPEWYRLLEEDHEKPYCRWISVEKRCVNACFDNPETLSDAYELHRRALALAPTALGYSPLNLHIMDVMYVFEMTYSGNNSELVARTMAPSGFETLAGDPNTKIAMYWPEMVFSLENPPDIQCRISVESRIWFPDYIRDRYDEENRFAVVFTARQYFTGINKDLEAVHKQLTSIAEKMIEKKVRPHIIAPLAEAIGSR